MLRIVLLCVVITFSSLCFASTSPPKPEAVERLEAVMLKMPWSISDREEKVPEREARARVMAKALHVGCRELQVKMSCKQLIAAAVSIWWHETRFSLEVHRGGLSRWGSDDGRAKCFGQLHAARVGIERHEGETLEEFRARQKVAWAALAGTDFEATKRCAIATMKAYRNSLGLCRGKKQPWIVAFGEYGLGNGECAELPQSERRYRVMLKVAARI